MRKIERHHLKTLDGLRGLSALYVLVHHARLGLTQPYQTGLLLHPEKYNWLNKLMVYFFGLFKYGHEAVIIFFVLSGFVIHLKYSDENYIFNNFKVFDYLKRRMIRIYPTLITSLALCVIIDLLIHYTTGENLNSLFQKYNITSFLYTLFLIPDSPIWGINYPIWSLKHEWFFYLIYPVLLVTATKNHLLSLGIVVFLYASFSLGIRISFIGTAAYTLLIWYLGCCLAYLYQNNKGFRYLPWLMLFALVYPCINREEVALYPLLDLIFGLITVGLIATLLGKPQTLISRLLRKLSGLATFSYTLYLVHSPIIYGFQKIISFYSPQKQLPYHTWYVLLASLTIIPISYIIYYYTERLAVNYKKKI